MALDLKKFIDRFIEEAREHLKSLAEGLSSLDGAPGDTETINTIFRSAHTIKGSSKMLKLGAINETAHKIEDILDAVRGGKLAYNSGLSELLYRGVDGLSDLVETLAKGAQLPEADQNLLVSLARPLQASGPAEASAEGFAAPAAPSVASTQAGDALSATPRPKAPDTVRIRLAKLDELIKLMGEVVSSHSRSRQHLVDIRSIERLRFSADMDAGSQLVQLQAEIHRYSLALRDDVLSQETLMNELHGKALVMRMLPLAMVFDPVGHTVRGIAQSLGKDVECVVSGSEIELDRQMIDKLSDPILHLLRNSVDHGIESPERRIASGKPKRGRIKLSACQDGAWVLVEIADDGGGISVDAIRNKALHKGLLSAEKIASMSRSEIIDLIFLPGFSTNSIVTDISGRGVGLDVVKSIIVGEMHGLVSVDSKLGVGTAFSLRLPLSLAVMRVLFVKVGGIMWGCTAQYVHELLRVESSSVLQVSGRQVVKIGGEFIPVVALQEILAIPQSYAQGQKRTPPSIGLLLLVVTSGNAMLALQIDELIDERDMVIKPLPPHLQKISLVSGMVTTGKNELVNILHVPALFEVTGKSGRPDAAGHAVSEGGALAEKQRSILVTDDSRNTREIEKDVLEAHGYVVTLAEDGLDALNKCREHLFDAVLTDVEMPNLDGFALTERLRQDERYRSVPIIIITSLQKEEDKRRGIEVGADAYIVKGNFEQGNLVETLRSFGL